MGSLIGDEVRKIGLGQGRGSVQAVQGGGSGQGEGKGRCWESVGGLERRGRESGREWRGAGGVSSTRWSGMFTSASFFFVSS